jgi:predicted CXXCH cytochrome family protein
VVGLSISVRAQRLPGIETPTSVTPKQIPAQPAADYVGADRCQSCHKPEYTEFHKTPHASLPKLSGMVAGCETCHGAGRAHADAEEAAKGDDAKSAAGAKLIFGFHGSTKENAARCLTCHESSKDQANMPHSEHFMHGVSCSQCHATHLVEGADEAAGIRRATTRPALTQIFQVPSPGVEATWLQDGLLKLPQPQVCFTCHADVQAKFALPTHHPVPEGGVKCTDCHQPHGSMNPAKLRDIRFRVCFNCHSEKTGPYVYEHAAVQVQGCVACHSPHGSVNHMLLNTREARFLCLQCHVDPTTANVPHGRLGFQASGDCTRCHVKVHGSNFNEFFLQ